MRKSLQPVILWPTAEQSLPHVVNARKQYDAGVRDRLVWIGDFKITAETIATSTMNYDAFRGTLQSVFDYIGDYGGMTERSPLTAVLISVLLGRRGHQQSARHKRQIRVSTATSGTKQSQLPAPPDLPSIIP